MKLRPYQEEALNEVRYLMGVEKLKRVMLYSPTGSGKTEMAISMIQGALARGRGVLFLAHQINLISQAVRRIERAGIPVGVLQSNNSRNLERNVIVGSIQTVTARGIPPRAKLIIVDEAHRTAGSKQYIELFRRCSNLPIIGLSASPFAKGLAKDYPEMYGPLFEDMVVAATIRQLIDEGFLVDCDIYAPSEYDVSGVKTGSNGDYVEKELAKAIADQSYLVGNIVEHWQRLARGTRTVVFATDIAHSKSIVNRFLKAGVPAEHIDAYTPDEEREAILRRVERGETLVISNVSVLAEGWDCPSVATMILARPTKSLTRWIQMAGRCLRPAEGKGRALLLDHSGSAKRLGYPTDDLPLELDDGKPKISGTGDDKPKEAKLPTECPSCKYLKPAGIHKCPRCGFAPEKQSELDESDERLALLERKKKREPTKEEKQLFYSMLLSIKGERNYSEGWVGHTYKKKFGVWPKGLAQIATEASPEVKSWVTSQLIRFAKGKQKGGDVAKAA